MLFRSRGDAQRGRGKRVLPARNGAHFVLQFHPARCGHRHGARQAALDEAEEWLTELTAGSARWRMLRAQTSCNLFWGEAWVYRLHDDVNAATPFLERAKALIPPPTGKAGSPEPQAQEPHQSSKS